MTKLKIQTGYVPNEVYQVKKVGKSYRLIDINNNDVGALNATSLTRKSALNEEKAIQAFIMKNGKKIFKKVSMDIFNSLVSPLNTDGSSKKTSTPEHQSVLDFIHKKSLSLRPKTLIMTDLKWKYLIRSAVRAKNIMMTGPAGCGKTLAAKTLTSVLKRPDFYFNLGATQDPRATLIGNTHFKKEEGTFFAESAFVKAIMTPNAVILLDELSRAHPDAWNILMTVLDEGQRYLRLDEAEGSPIIKVADGVTFVATANIGNEYTSTRVLDRAILDRFVTIEMDVLTDKEEFKLLKLMFPKVKKTDLQAVADIANHTRIMAAMDDGKLSEIVSTRASVEMGGLLYDGFSLFEAAEIAIFPFFSPDGGSDSERTYIKQYVQKFKKDNSKENIYDTTKSVDDIEDTVPQF